MSWITTEKTQNAASHTPALYLVFGGTEVLGILERYRSTQTERHPWKAYAYRDYQNSQDTIYLGAFYPEYGESWRETRERAIQRLVQYHQVLECS